MSSDDVAQIEHAFAPLRQRLRVLKERLNPSGQNLHFGGTLNVVPPDFDELLTLAEEGLRAVRQQDDFFSRHSLYGDRGFWYNLFLLISAASLHGRRGLAVSASVLHRLVEVLVDVSHYSLAVLGGELGVLGRRATDDMIKRNHEALGNLLYGFAWPSLRVLVTQRGMQSPQVTEFVAWTLGAVERASQ